MSLHIPSIYIFVPYISGNSKAPGVGTLPMFCIEKPFCACTAQRNLRIVWRLQNRILVSVKIKLQAITSGNDNIIMVIYRTAPWEINNIPAPKARTLEGAGASQLYHSLYSVWDCTALVQYMCSPRAVHIPYTVQTMIYIYIIIYQKVR